MKNWERPGYETRHYYIDLLVGSGKNHPEALLMYQCLSVLVLSNICSYYVCIVAVYILLSTDVHCMLVPFTMNVIMVIVQVTVHDNVLAIHNRVIVRYPKGKWSTIHSMSILIAQPI